MPAIAALSINDGASTPVAHTFNPVSTTGARASWADRSSGLPSGYLTLTHEVRQPGQVGSAYRIIIGANNPVVADVAGVDQVVRNSSAKVELNFSALSSEQERKDLLAYVTNFLSNASVKTSVQNIEPFY